VLVLVLDPSIRPWNIGDGDGQIGDGDGQIGDGLILLPSTSEPRKTQRGTETQLCPFMILCSHSVFSAPS
jgi:hypothetical protein